MLHVCAKSAAFLATCGHMCLVTNPAHAPLLLAAPTQRLLGPPKALAHHKQRWLTNVAHSGEERTAHTRRACKGDNTVGATTPTKSWKRPTVNVVSAGAPLFMRRAKLQRYSSRRRNEDKVICCKSMRLVGMRWCVGWVCGEVWPCDTSLVHGEAHNPRTTHWREESNVSGANEHSTALLLGPQ